MGVTLISRSRLVWAATFGILLVLAGAQCFEAGKSAPRFVSSSFAAPAERAVLNEYCITCHNEKLHTAGLALDKADIEHVSGDAATWEKVLSKIRSGAMPPAGRPRPDQPTFNSLAAYLEKELDAAAAAEPNPGRPAVHRLNRAEYANAVRDLLGLDIDALDIQSLLPADDSGYGFDNIADVLSV